MFLGTVSGTRIWLHVVNRSTDWMLPLMERIHGESSAGAPISIPGLTSATGAGD